MGKKRLWETRVQRRAQEVALVCAFLLVVRMSYDMLSDECVLFLVR